MIVTFTPNPAWDVTLRTESLQPGHTHATVRLAMQAGGKGINTASVLHALGHPVQATAVVGAADEPMFGADLAARGIAHRLLTVPGRTRQSTAVTDADGEATVFNEPGITWECEPDLVVLLETQDPDPRALTISGSVPPGAQYAVHRLIRRAATMEIPLVLDLRDGVLRDALELRPALVKLNRAEAASTLGCALSTPPADLAEQLLTRGAGAAAVSDGAGGVTLVTDDGSWHARTRDPLQGNATGAGDAMTAAFALGMSEATEWPDALARAVTWSAAAVLQPLAGQVDAADIDNLRSAVHVKELHR